MLKSERIAVRHFILYTLAFSLVCCGCKTTTFEQVLNDGRRIKVRDVRFITMTAATIEGTIDPSNGVIRIRVSASSRPDPQALEAMAKGVAQGVVAAMK